MISIYSRPELLLIVVLVIAEAVTLHGYLRERGARKQRRLLGDWPIRAVLPDAVDPIFRPGPFGPTLDTEIAFVGRGPFDVQGSTTENTFCSRIRLAISCVYCAPKSRMTMV